MGTSRECYEEREDKLGRAVPRSVTGKSGLTLYMVNLQDTMGTMYIVPLYGIGKHTGFRYGLKNFHSTPYYLSTIE